MAMAITVDHQMFHQEIIRSVLDSAELHNDGNDERGDWATTPVEGLEETAKARPWEAEG